MWILSPERWTYPDSDESSFCCATVLFVHSRPDRSAPVCTQLCHSRVSETLGKDHAESTDILTYRGGQNPANCANAVRHIASATRRCVSPNGRPRAHREPTCEPSRGDRLISTGLHRVQSNLRVEIPRSPANSPGSENTASLRVSRCTPTGSPLLEPTHLALGPVRRRRILA